MFGNYQKFRFWCQKVLPLVYDDSISYYETLCKVVKVLNDLIAGVNELPDYIREVIQEEIDIDAIKDLMKQYVEGLQNAISFNNEGDNTNASKDYDKDDMLWLNDKLYIALRNIETGDTFVTTGNNPNLALVSFEELFNTFTTNIKDDFNTFSAAIKEYFTANDEGNNTNASRNIAAGEWLWLNNKLYIATKDIDQGVTFILTGDNANLYNIDIESVVGNIAELTTAEKDNLVDAINELKAGLDDAVENVGDLDELTTEDKDSVVDAINEVDYKVKHISTDLKYLLAGEYNHEAIPDIFAEYIVDYESDINTRPYNQGGCADDDYYYQFLSSSGDTYSWCYKIDKSDGSITKYSLSVADHYNGACVLGNYIVTVHGTNMYVFNKANMTLLYHHTVIENYAIADIGDGKVAMFDGSAIHIYDMSDIGTPVFISTTEIMTPFTQQAPTGMVFINDVLLIGGWTAANQSSIIYAYELNGNLITTITLPTNDAELESIALEGNKLVLMYQRQWNQAFCSCAFKVIDLYNLQTSVSALDEGDSYGVGTYNVYVYSTYTGFYVDGTSSKPFVSLNYAAQFIERIVANEKNIYITGNHGYVTFSHTGDNIILRGGTIKRVTAYCKSLQINGCTIDASTYSGECVYARNCNLILYGSTFIAQSSYHCINTAYGQVMVTGACSFSGGDYGLYMQYCSVYISATLTDNGVTTKLVYANTCQILSNGGFSYNRSNANIIIDTSFGVMMGTASIPSIATNSSTDIEIEFSRTPALAPRLWLTKRSNGTAEFDCYIKSIDTSKAVIKVINKGDSATGSSNFLYWLAIGG